MAWVLDLDGVVWLAGSPIPGAAEAVARLRASGETVLYVTNFSALTEAEAEGRLADCGIDATGSVVTSAMAAASLVEPGERVLVCAGPGVAEAVQRRGADAVEPSGRRPADIDAVIVGYHTDFDYDRLAAAQHAVLGGARLIATNDDPTYPTTDGLLPGNGALAAAVATAAKTTAAVAGKPYPPVASLVHERVGSTPGDPANHARHIMVGDLPATDGMVARRLGYRFGLVLSGVTPASALPVDPEPDVIAADLASLVDDHLTT